MDKPLDYVLQKLHAAKAAGDFPDFVTLAIYKDNESLRRFRPTEDWQGGAAEHKRAMLSIASRISHEYPSLTVELFEIDNAAYNAWLLVNNLNDSDATRAAFISYREEER